MKRITLVVAAGAALLAGCSGGGSADANADGEITAQEVAKKAEAEIAKPEPGLYKTTVTMTEIAIPGMPPEMNGHGAGMTTTSQKCLTQEEVDKGFEELFKQGQNGDCTYERLNLAGGKVDAVMVCNSKTGSARMEMTGTTSTTGADLAAKMAMEFDGAGKGTMSFTAKHERIGDCPAGK